MTCADACIYAPWPQMKEQKAAEAVPEEHEEQETKGIKAEEQPEVPSPHTPVVSTPTNRGHVGRPNQIS